MVGAALSTVVGLWSIARFVFRSHYFASILSAFKLERAKGHRMICETLLDPDYRESSGMVILAALDSVPERADTKILAALRRNPTEIRQIVDDVYAERIDRTNKAFDTLQELTSRLSTQDDVMEFLKASAIQTGEYVAECAKVGGAVVQMTDAVQALRTAVESLTTTTRTIEVQQARLEERIAYNGPERRARPRKTTSTKR